LPAGLQYAFNRTTADLGHFNSKAYISSYSPVGYFSVFSKHAYAEAAYAPSYNTYYGVRQIAFSTINRTAQSLSNGWNHASEFTAGYDAGGKRWTFGPFARALYDSFRVQPIVETGAGSLNLMIHKMKAESLRTEAGGRLRGMFKTSDHAVFRPTLEGAWVHESLDDSTPIVGALSEPGGGQLIVYSSRPVRNGFAGRAGLEAVVIPNLSFFVDYGIQTNLNIGAFQGVWGGARLWF
jgi:outer membrane autotransporter protein